ncbi:MAG: alcohol dehydrogenase catalytic domain-containing protein [Melioribacteraceae bacterium]|nr:alcohol dehydrogenase catalytic domain-containing protein [Melioribacteraceae bacterium]
MKAAVLIGIRNFEIQEIPEPKIVNDNDVLIRIKMVGVCGSDIHYYTTGRIGSQIVKYPFIVGHEAAGVVEQVGSKVTRVKPGQKIAIDPAISCGKCDQCLAGRENTCRELVFMGNPKERNGALCEYIVHNENSCYPVSESITFEQAVMSEPLAIAVYAVDGTRNKAGSNIGIFGAGPIGMSVFHVLRTTDAGNIYVTDKIKERLDFAQQLNPAWSGNPADAVMEIKNREAEGLDVVYECSGDPDVFDQAAELLKPGGILSIIGIPEVDRISLPVHEMRRKEITIINVRRQSGSTQKAIDLLEGNRVSIDSMASHHYQLEDTQAAFDLVAGYRDGVMKAMISLD